MLTMFNCGQGDAMLLKPSYDSHWSEVPLLIDAGPRSFTPSVTNGEIDLLLTHPHLDHYGGCANIPSNISIRLLYLPKYWEQTTKVLDFFHRHCYGQNHPLLDFTVDFLRNSQIQSLKHVHDGFNFIDTCMHVYNPIFNMAPLMRNNHLKKTVDSFLAKNFDITIGNFSDSNTALDDAVLSKLSSPDERKEYKGGNSESFIYWFIYRFVRNLLGTNGKHPLTLNKSHSQKIIADALYTTELVDAHKISVVCKYSYRDSDHQILFTGDADITVFRRLIRRTVDMSSSILKIPHHGSSGNLDRSILQAIRPEIALISHDNGVFRGGPNDPHPHQVTLADLIAENINFHCTNDVIKPNLPRHTRSIGLIGNYPVIFQ